MNSALLKNNMPEDAKNDLNKCKVYSNPRGPLTSPDYTPAAVLIT